MSNRSDDSGFVSHTPLAHIALMMAFPLTVSYPWITQRLLGPVSNVLVAGMVCLGGAGVGGFLTPWDYITWKQGLMFATPLYQLIIVGCSYQTFTRFVRREPENTVFNFRPGPWIDSVYAILTILISIMPPILLIFRSVR